MEGWLRRWFDVGYVDQDVVEVEVLELGHASEEP